MSDQPQSKIDTQAQLSHAREILINDTLSTEPTPALPGAEGQRAGINNDPVDETARKLYRQAEPLLQSGSLGKQDQLKAIGLPEIVYHYLNQRPGTSSKTIFERIDQKADGHITGKEIAARIKAIKSDLIEGRAEDLVLEPILTEYASGSSGSRDRFNYTTRSSADGLTIAGVREAAKRNIEFRQRDQQELKRSEENIALAQRIIKAIPKDKFEKLNVDKNTDKRLVNTTME